LFQVFSLERCSATRTTIPMILFVGISYMVVVTNSKLIKRAFTLFMFFVFLCSCGPVDIIPPSYVDPVKKPDGKKDCNDPPKQRLTCHEDDQTLFRNNSNFTDRWIYCGRRNSGYAQETVNCIRNEHQFRALSPACGACFGEFTACGRANCKWDCWRNSRSRSCKNCGEKNCGDAFAQCSGVPLHYITY